MSSQWMRLTLIGFIGTTLLLLASDPPGSIALVTDPAGQEVRLTDAKISGGTRPLRWQAGQPDAISFRELDSTQYKDGVLTLIPMDSVKRLSNGEIRQGKAILKTVSIMVAGLEKPLVGPGQFKGVNQFGVEGISGEKRLKYLAGSSMAAFQAVEFPGAKPRKPNREPASNWSVTGDQPRGGAAFKVANLKVLLASVNGSEQTSENLPLRGTETVPLAALRSITVIAHNPTSRLTVVDIVSGDGVTRTVVVSPNPTVDGKEMKFLGLLGEVPAGWRLIPLPAIVSIKRE